MISKSGCEVLQCGIKKPYVKEGREEVNCVLLVLNILKFASLIKSSDPLNKIVHF